ncbi:hypothetical protein L7F22_062332 [Adiantum nelumboides]|nr:hypothetical protein [Adiantum nelumboides]
MASFGGVVVTDPALANKFTQAELRALKSQFNLLKSKEGLVTAAELELGINNLNLFQQPLTKKEIVGILKQQGSHLQDGLNFETFLKLYLDLQKCGNPKVSPEKKASAFLKQATTTLLHHISQSEKKAYVDHINAYLENDTNLSKVLPIDSSSNAIFDIVKDGVLLCKLINRAVPGTIDERALNIKRNLNVWERVENHNLCLNSAKAIGCSMVNIGTQDLMEGRPHLVLGLISQIVKIQLLANVNLKETPELVEMVNDTEQLQQAARDSLVEGLPTVRSPTGVCEPCQLGKQHRVAFPKQASTRASAPLALVHTDLCGPMSTSSLSGLCYMLVLVDDFSRYTWVSFLKLKSEAFGSIRDRKAMVEKEKDLKVKSIRSDRGGEFLSENFARWCKSEGIRRQLTTPYTPSQNGVVERKNRTIMEMARAMLAHASLPRSYWAEARNTAVYIQNRSPIHALQDMIPFQAYYGRKPTVSHFRVFGCSAFIHIPKEKRQKLDFKSRKLLFLGYSAESDAYRLYDPDTRTTTVSRDAVFDESFITSAEGAAAQPIPILPPPSLPDPPASPVITPSTSHPVPPIQPPDVSPDHALSDSDFDLDVADATPEVDAAPPRREKRIPGWLYSTEIEELLNLPADKVLLRWMNYHLKKAGSLKVVSNFSSDIKDCEAYTILLHTLAPQSCDLTPLDFKDPLERAKAVLVQADQIGCRKYVSPKDIVDGSTNLNLAFIANLFHERNGLTLEYTTVSFAELLRDDEQTSREERAFRMWIKSWNFNLREQSFRGFKRRVESLSFLNV